MKWHVYKIRKNHKLTRDIDFNTVWSNKQKESNWTIFKTNQDQIETKKKTGGPI